MRTKSSRGQTLGEGAMEWARQRVSDPAHRDDVQALMTEIDVRQELIELREQRGITQAQLAEKVGVQQPMISKLEGRGTQDVKLSTLVKVAAALGARVRITLEPHEEVRKRPAMMAAGVAPENGRKRTKKRRAA